MRLRTIAIVGAVAASVAVIGRRYRLVEDLEWADVQKPGRLIEIDGCRVHYRDEGAGPAVVLIHGFGGQTYQYRRLIPVLSRDHRVIAVDLKGFGYSERVEGGLSHSAQVAMLKQLLHELGIERATFVGHSMGGAVAQRFAATHPQMVDALVLAASASGDERFDRRMPPKFVLKPMMPVMGKLLGDRLFKASFNDPSKATPEIAAEYHRPERIKGSMDGLLVMMLEGATDPPIDMAAITQPVLILSAADDRVVPLNRAQKLRERLPHARLVVIDRAGHLLFEEQPGVCASAIVDFLRDVRSGTAAGIHV